MNFFSILIIVALKSTFLTKLLWSGISISTVLNVEFAVKPLILRVLLSTLLILAL